MPIEQTLTGRRRHRLYKPLFGKQVLILQLEVSGVIVSNHGGHIDAEESIYWVDAQPHHLLMEDEQKDL